MGKENRDLTGMVFGRWSVTERAEKNKEGKRMWLCLCLCDDKTVRSVLEKSLISGHSKSCGCFVSKSKYKDLSGHKFGKLIVIEKLEDDKHGRQVWLCECSCENKIRKPVMVYYLTNGETTSCGCIGRNRLGEEATTHGHTKNGKHTKEYNTWRGMIERCNNEKHEQYADYGGRGIRVCERWMESFESFLADMGYKPSPKHSIDRIKTNGDYTPENCQWSDWATQSRNKRIKNPFGVSGVYARGNRYGATIGLSGKKIFIGHFQTLEEAIQARIDAEERYWH